MHQSENKNQINNSDKQRGVLIANSSISHSKWKPIVEPQRAKPKTIAKWSRVFWSIRGDKWVKQGCVLAWTLFSMMFSAMLTDAFQDGNNGISTRYRFNGKPFNLRRLQAKSKVQTKVLVELLVTWKRVLQQKKNAKRRVSSIWFMWQLWSHNQHQKDGQYISQQLESLTRSLPTLWKINDCKW